MNITATQADQIAAAMRDLGFDVTRLADDRYLAFTCPPRSSVVFGAVIADVLHGTWTDRQVTDLLIAATTSHPDRSVPKDQRGPLTLYFPGYTVERQQEVQPLKQENMTPAEAIRELRRRNRRRPSRVRRPRPESEYLADYLAKRLPRRWWW